MFRKCLGVAVAFVIAGTAIAAEKTAWDFTLTSIDYTDMPMEAYKGKAVLVVNTASYCGFTPQYEGLQKLYDEYKDKGLVVLGVPANDFGDQEPGSERNIKNFCKVNFAVDFPMTKKMVVNGSEGTADFYNWMAEEQGEDSRPKWNFHKYLIGRDGHTVAWFGTKVEPDSPELKAAVEKALN
ncbi:glutathione peroxidase [Gimibacter soli]|uniref:Glutathione peroxidase n=1 Tax=Gimibacter soli TaxID=3024400 RepID=A0AAF0BN59_9PROT|nr:glutathione peroxidase [Gimibacter soli]WCL55501.1 glutathione peroxidase [Gimibacter soli]